ncbi:hypothetical protein D9M68_411530 [compost metagenome]
MHEPAAEAAGQRLADFLQAWVHVLVDGEQLARLHAGLAVHALEAGRAGLQGGDAGRVFVGHPQRQVARGFAQQAVGVVGQLGHSGHAVEVETGVGQVLVVDEAAHAFEQEVLRGQRKVALHALDQRAHGRVARLRCGRGGRCDLGGFAVVAVLGAVEGRAEGLEAGLHAHAAALDGGLELRAAERQHARACERAEQHGADHAARGFGGLRHVEADEALGGARGVGEQLVAVDAAVAHGALFGDGEDAVRGGDERGAVARDQPTLHRAAGFHELGGKHHVDIARQRHQREHGAPAVGLRLRIGVQLDVIDGRAGALGHAWHRGGLGDIAVGLAHVDDPVGKHAAALPAHSEDGDLDGLNLVRHGVRRHRRHGGARRRAAASR